MRPSDFLSLDDLSAEELQALLVLAGEMKGDPVSFRGSLEGRSQALIFEKPSLRTRTTFEVAMAKLSGVPDFSFLIVDYPYIPTALWSEEEIRKLASEVAPAVRQRLTSI